MYLEVPTKHDKKPPRANHGGGFFFILPEDGRKTYNLIFKLLKNSLPAAG